jgi:hypothetical protein
MPADPPPPPDAPGKPTCGTLFELPPPPPPDALMVVIFGPEIVVEDPALRGALDPAGGF